VAASSQGPPADTEKQAPVAPPDKLPAPSKDQRKWLSILWDYYQTQTQQKLLDTNKAKLLKLCYMHFNRYPASVSDVEQAKKWIRVEELL
jgi:hypothetical protein